MMDGNTIPRDNETYKNKEYWDLRFQEEKQYEWLESFATLKDHILEYIRPEDSILVIGCGSSSLSSDLYNAGFCNVTSLDYSEVVINNLKDIHSAVRPEMCWVCADMRELQSTFPERTADKNAFDVVIDKAGMDALLTDEKSAWHPSATTIEDCHCVFSGYRALPRSPVGAQQKCA